MIPLMGDCFKRDGVNDEVVRRIPQALPHLPEDLREKVTKVLKNLQRGLGKISDVILGENPEFKWEAGDEGGKTDRMI